MYGDEKRDETMSSNPPGDDAPSTIRLSSREMRRRITRGDFFGLTLRDAMIATVARELEEHQERDAAAAALTVERSRRQVRDRGVGPSVVVSLRLSSAEAQLLEERAEQLGIVPSALARNLIRAGLRQAGPADAARVMDEIARRLDDLRTTLA